MQTDKLEPGTCPKCGADNRNIRFVPSSGMDITPTGMFADCGRCGYSEKIKSLDEKS